MRKRGGQVIAYQYDPMNRLIVKDLPGTTTGDIYYSYFSSGAITEMRFNAATDPLAGSLQRDPMGRIIKDQSAIYRWVSSVYDADGNRSRVALGSGPYNLYTYDLAERLKKVDINDASGALIQSVATYTYGTLNRRSSLTRPNATRTDYSFDAAGRLVGLSNTAVTPSTSSTQTFAYNPAGQTTATTQGNSAFTWSGQPTTTTNFTHDALNRDAAIATAGGGACPGEGWGHQRQSHFRRSASLHRSLSSGRRTAGPGERREPADLRRRRGRPADHRL